MAEHFEEIYRNRALDYDRMVTAEDADQAIRPALEAIVPLAGARVVEVGVGTARLTRLLVAAGVEAILGVDRSAAMLAVARDHLATEAPSPSPTRWQLAVADMMALPVSSDWAGLALAGWVLGHATEWSAERWRADVDGAVSEMSRVLAPGGAAVIIETLGTGMTTPASPTPALARYYEHLEHQHGFKRVEIQTDFVFSSPSEAAEACGFFFGEEFARAIRDNAWSRVPEWTGVWSRRF